MEYRKPLQTKSSSLPVDYLQMLKGVFQREFDAELKLYSNFRSQTHLEAYGSLAGDEIILALSLLSPGSLIATTFYASTDFDPKATTPTAEDLLAVCVDALDSLLHSVFDSQQPHQIEKLASESLSEVENIPFDWTPIEIQKRKIFVKIDKANLSLEQLADAWLKKNDPVLQQQDALETARSDEVIITHKKSHLKH